MKVILDTNVVMSGLFWPGHSREILILLDENRFYHLCSKEIADEYIDVANRMKKKIKNFDVNILDELIEMILMKSIFCEPFPGSGPECRDPKDQMFLDLAVTMGAKYIVSGDKDLLVLDKYVGGKVIKPKLFLDAFYP